MKSERNVGQKLAVVVVTYNSVKDVGDLLDSLPAGVGNVLSTTIVVDNGSTDGTVELLRQRDDVVLVEATNGGYASGVNIGMHASPNADAWLVLNPDLVCEPGLVPPMLAALGRPRVGIVGPRVLSADGELQPSMRREPTLLRNLGLSFTGRSAFCEYVEEPHVYSRGGPADWVLGAALMVSKECRSDVGDWDSSYFLYSEETEYCLRARDQGWLTWFVPEGIVRHTGGGSGQSGATHSMQIINRVRLYTRRHATPAAILYFLLTVASEASWLARGAAKSRASLIALLIPSRRPEELACGRAFLPR